MVSYQNYSFHFYAEDFVPHHLHSRMRKKSVSIHRNCFDLFQEYKMKTLKKIIDIICNDKRAKGVSNMILVKVIFYVNVENHFLTFTKITFTRIMLGTPLI